jgi:hypothetical protein
MSNVTLTATEFVAALGHSLADWALGTDWTVVVFADGTVNALDAAGVAYYDLAAANVEATAAAAALYRAEVAR